MLPTVCAALIVRDEERFLDDCLKSIAGEVDDLVIVDTGSTDRTVEIARAYGARIFHHPWTGDFAAARNAALDHASGDWILYIDADERLRVIAPGDLRRALDRPEAVAGLVAFQPRVGYTPYHEIRLFRRDPRIRFRSAIHETVHPAIREVAASDGLRIVELAVALDHVGYEGDIRHKYVRNLPILREALRRTPERIFLWIDTAQALAGLGRRDEAEAVAWRAIDRAVHSADAKQRADATLAWQCLVDLHLGGERKLLAVELARRAHTLYPTHHGLALALANALFENGFAHEALPMCDDLLAIDAETFVDPLTAYDKRLFGAWPAALKGAALLRLGRRAEAADAFAVASGYAPQDPGLRAKAIALRGPKA